MKLCIGCERFILLGIRLQIGTDIWSVPTAAAVATGEVNCYNVIGHTEGSWRQPARGTVAQSNDPSLARMRWARPTYIKKIFLLNSYYITYCSIPAIYFHVHQANTFFNHDRIRNSTFYAMPLDFLNIRILTRFRLACDDRYVRIRLHFHVFRPCIQC